MPNSKLKLNSTKECFDLFIIGGGVNGTGIARDASGRGLKVVLAEMNDLASATSSASTKLFHGGLRYLEFFEFRLVQEALVEREILLRAMPHISWPIRFVLPYSPKMRFELSTPLAKLLSFLMPWMKGKRPWWLIRLGLYLYDNLGSRKLLSGTKIIDLKTNEVGLALKDEFKRAFEYSDCWVQDSRLVLLNAKDAFNRGAKILTQSRVISANRVDDLWQIKLEDKKTKSERVFYARSLINASGPWVQDLIEKTIETNLGTQSKKNKKVKKNKERVQLVKGSHIITKKLFEHNKCYFFQGKDGRIVFAIPYETDFTLIGTTDVNHPNPETKPICTKQEKNYLCDFVSDYFKKPLKLSDIVASFSGIRPLYDNDSLPNSAISRDYTLKLDTNGAPLLNIFGGKITTYRRLAQSALSQLEKFFPQMKPSWTATSPLPGGNFKVSELNQLINSIQKKYSFLEQSHILRLVRAYGTETKQLLSNAQKIEDLGEYFGETVYAKELDWVIRYEWVQSADDFIMRRSKLFLRLNNNQIHKIDSYIQEKIQNNK